MSGLDVHSIQYALVCMHFDPAYAAMVRGPQPLPELGERERELLRGVDTRALATDAMRRTRALHAILDEYPVSAAILGLDAVDAFFSSPAFRACVFGRGSMALSFGREFLGDRAAGVGAIELAMAQVRRPAHGRPDSAPRPGQLACAPTVAAVIVPAGSLAHHQRLRARLGEQPLLALAALSRRESRLDAPPRRSSEHLLVEAKADGSIALGTASEALVELLRAAAQPLARDRLAQVAVTLGADAHEADELLDDLLGEALLCAG